ncbi:MAG: AAA family ATPase, partial [Myxococcota bacterium]
PPEDEPPRPEPGYAPDPSDTAPLEPRRARHPLDGRDPLDDLRRAGPVIPRETTDEVKKAFLRESAPPPAAHRDPPPPPAARLDLSASPRPAFSTPPAMELPEQPRWQPREPRTWEEAGLDPLLGEQLVLRYFVGTGTESARTVANDLCLALPLTKELLEQLKTGKLLQHRGSTAMGDFIYELTEAGRSKALDYKRLCAYVGPAPVPWTQYLQSVRDQTLRSRTPTAEDLGRAFEDLLVSQDLVDRLGPAITSGRAMFLHGDPGNGKTSIAERITRCFGDEIWIPHALLVDGHLVKLYDPATHEQVDPAFKPLTPSERLDRRWVKIRRPTVVAGGELTLEMLEIQLNEDTNICEAPLQLKANCGTLVIDDFGRQRMEPQLLLNRWIFPLERRIDFLRLPDGRKITSPFDPLLIFSTNLEPHDLVDEAFLRRIPYKLKVCDPTEDEFIALVELVAARLDVVLAEGVVEYLVDRHYKQTGRKLRFCHPRDLLMQIVHQCAYERRHRFATPADFDRAVENYFGAL